jgi:hypothetical protein
MRDSVDTKTPAAWIATNAPEDQGKIAPQGRIGAPEANGKAVEVDARALAKECLRVLGRRSFTTSESHWLTDI